MPAKRPRRPGPARRAPSSRLRGEGWGEGPGGVRTRSALRARRAPSLRLRGEGWGEGSGECAHPAPHPLAIASRPLPAGGERERVSPVPAVSARFPCDTASAVVRRPHGSFPCFGGRGAVKDGPKARRLRRSRSLTAPLPPKNPHPCARRTSLDRSARRLEWGASMSGRERDTWPSLLDLVRCWPKAPGTASPVGRSARSWRCSTPRIPGRVQRRRRTRLALATCLGPQLLIYA